ncbi:MAG: MOSC domain-containing protein YiiM [Alphaproteobacteria bacterium]|jgi:MOSC domain-containing protein YiiM
MNSLSVVEYLYAGKPKPFGPRQSPSSIVKKPHVTLHVKFEGALEDEQGNKKLHGGPYMALHQFAQQSYLTICEAFPDSPQEIVIGTIGENISAPNMHESNVFIGDQYQIGSAIVKVVSPRTPCSKINQRYGAGNIDLLVAKHAITGWYYSVLQEGEISKGDDIILLHRDDSPISIKEIWELRQLKLPTEDPQACMALASRAFQDPSLAPEWQAFMHRVTVRLAKYF